MLLSIRVPSAEKYEFLKLDVEPSSALVAASGLSGLTFGSELRFEFEQNVERLRIDYAERGVVAPTVRSCGLWIEHALAYRDFNGSWIGVLIERTKYELAHKNAVTAARGSARVAAPVLTEQNRDDEPPTISITSFDTDQEARTDQYIAEISGTVADNEGVMRILVNGIAARMKADGTFLRNVRLRVGENPIEIAAEDLYGNIAKVSFLIIRSDYVPEDELPAVDVPPVAGSSRPDGIAVVIGIEEYQYVSDATYAYNDAEVFREYLAESLGFHKSRIRLISNRQATLGEMRRLLGRDGWLARNVRRGESEVVVFFSGHGIPDPKTGQTGILPSDIDPNYSIGFPLVELYEALEQLGARSVVVFLDACFTGEDREHGMLLTDTRGFRRVPPEPSTSKNFSVLSAAGMGQYSGAAREVQHGLFTYYVLRGLRGEADSNADRTIDSGELADFVGHSVAQEAAMKGREQVPELFGSRDVILRRW